MKNGFKPLRSEDEFRAWFHAFQATTYLGIIKCAFVGCVLTMVVQSSSATLGITIGLASTGVIEFQTAAALVMGEIAQGLARRSGLEFVGVHRKATAATPCEEALLEQIAQEADFVLTGTAD